MFSSILRAFPRLALLALLGALFIFLSSTVGRALDPVFAPILFNFGLCMLALAMGDGALRLLQPQVNPQTAANEAIAMANYGAGLVYLGRCVLAAAVLVLFATSTRAAEAPPAAALKYLPVLKAQQLAWWPDLHQPSILGAQVEQETCITLTHRSCWNPRAELKTSREYGFGLGMITVTSRFNVFDELRAENKSALGAWRFEDRYDPELQLRALVLKDRAGFEQVRGAASFGDRMAFTLAGYNGGAGGVRSDRVMCRSTPGCDSTRWTGNVERTSLKARQAVQGYGKSSFEINRGYVRNVMIVRRPRYLVLDA